VLELAVALKKEAPGRTAAQIAVILAAQSGWAPSERTLQRHFKDLGICRTRPDGSVPAAFGRFEAEQPNARWVADALHGPMVAGRKAILIAFLDDHSRLVVAARWGYHENAMALRETFKTGLSARGYPKVLYVDNGSMFIDSALRRTCAVIGAKLTHSTAGKPQGRGKIERFFRTVRDQFLVEIADGTPGIGAVAGTQTRTGTRVTNLADLNSLFEAWLHQVYHQRVHSETEQTPLQRFLAHGAPTPVPGDLLDEAFRWSEWRTVTSAAQVNLHGNLYDVDASLVGARVELVFNPDDLDNIDVRVHGKSYGKALPSRLRRHVHPKAVGDPAPAPVPTGIDYLRLIEARHTHSLENRLRYAHLDPQTAPQTAPAEGTTTGPVPQSDADNAGKEPIAVPEAICEDDEATRYETDLVALAAAGPAGPAGADTDPALAPDPALEAELAGFAALLTHLRSDSGIAGERPQAAS
jgi:putative transposase